MSRTKNFKFLKFIVFIILIGSIPQSCAVVGKGKLAVSKSTNFIPPDFGNEPTSLLIQLDSQHENKKKIKKIIADNYTGEYEIINYGNRNSTKYSDTDKYRYIYYHEFDMSTMSNFATTGMSASTFSYLPVILDRKTGKEYPYSISNGLKIVVKMYMKALNKEITS
jgi:hypothetical protein